MRIDVVDECSDGVAGEELSLLFRHFLLREGSDGVSSKYRQRAGSGRGVLTIFELIR